LSILNVYIGLKFVENAHTVEHTTMIKNQNRLHGLWIALAVAMSGCLEQTPLPQAPQSQYTYGDAANEAAGEAVLLPDGGFLLVGGSQDEDSRDYDLYVVKIDAVGNEVFARKFGTRERDEVGWKIAPCANGEYVIAGTSRAKTGGASLLQLTLLDADLNVRWQASSTTNVPNTGLSLESGGFYQMPDGHFILGFAIEDYPVVMRFDDRGIKLDENLISDHNGDAQGHFFTRAADGTFVLAAVAKNYLQAQSVFDLLQYDSLGNYVRFTPIGVGPDVPLVVVFAITGMHNGRYGLSLYDQSQGRHIFGILEPGLSTAAYFFRGNNADYNAITELPSGHLLLTGYDSYGNIYDYGYNQSADDFRVVLADTLGNDLRVSSYGGTAVERPHSAVSTGDGRVLLFGETSSYGAGGTDLYVVLMND
jgi:hypothetical protein